MVAEWQSGFMASADNGLLRAPVIARPVAGVVRARPQGTALSCQWLCSKVHAIRHQGVVVRYALKAALLGH